MKNMCEISSKNLLGIKFGLGRAANFLNIYGRNRKNKFGPLFLPVFPLPFFRFSLSLDGHNSRPLFEFSRSADRSH